MITWAFCMEASMKVYQLLDTAFEPYTVIATFASVEAAEAKMRLMENSQAARGFCIEIEERDVIDDAQYIEWIAEIHRSDIGCVVHTLAPVGVTNDMTVEIITRQTYFSGEIAGAGVVFPAMSHAEAILIAKANKDAWMSKAHDAMPKLRQKFSDNTLTEAIE